MKRLILTAVALSFLAVPMANAQSNQARQGYAQAQSFETAQNWNKPQKRIVKKRVVKKQVIKKQVVRKPVAQKKRWARGQNVPAWQRKQVVRDYHRYGLRKPGNGQHWVRVGNDYLLISIFSGIIANLIVVR